MDLRTSQAVTLVLRLLLLITPSHAEFNVTQSPTNSTTPSDNALTCHCPTAPSSTPPGNPDRPSSIQVLVHTSSWSQCDGVLTLRPLWPSNAAWSKVVYSEETIKRVKTVLKSVCEQIKGCSGPPTWMEELTAQDCQLNQEPSTSLTSEAHCYSMRLRCSVKEEAANIAGQLQAYKTATALLCCVLLVVAVIRFTRPTIEALQKRLSDRRQNRWVGPTQSHSVSYNRGKTTVKSNDPEKRLSYPALERLTVAGSREPSSNRSSYNF